MTGAAVGFLTLSDGSRQMQLYRNTRTIFITMATIAVIASLLLAGVAAKGITDPLESVVEAARTVHKGIWPEPFTVSRNDEIGILQVAFNDMTAGVRASQERLLSMLDLDPLTELANHRKFKEQLLRQVENAEVSGLTISLLIFDIDGFQKFNSTNGHAKGDWEPKQIANNLRESLPADTIIARYGGDEFAAILLESSACEAEIVAAQLIDRLEARWSSDPATHSLAISIGISEVSACNQAGESVTLMAEIALEQAKRLGRNQFHTVSKLDGLQEGNDLHTLF